VTCIYIEKGNLLATEIVKEYVGFTLHVTS